ncbi:MAG: hypothetical protein QXL17_06190 [Candidatus Thermoplasmatota archaeon]
MSQNNNFNLLKEQWKKSTGDMTCPQCKSPLTIIQLEQLYDPYADYPTYKTIIECSKCSFKINTQSSTILGSVKNFTDRTVEIGSWSISGSRISSTFDHTLHPDVLHKLKKSGELVEFLIVNNQVVQIIG